MESQSSPIDLEARIRQLEARNRRLEQATIVTLALLILVSVLLVQQRWSAAEQGKAMALLLDENRKPQAAVTVTPSGNVRLMSLRPDGSLPGASQLGGVTLYDAAGNPRVLFGSRPGEVARASYSTPQSADSQHACVLSRPADLRGAHHTVAEGPKKEEGEAASVREERAPDGSRVKTVLFKDLLLDRLYPSMTGPRKMQRLVLGSDSDKEVWITGFRAEVLDDKNQLASQQFMCHSSLDVVGRSGTEQESYRGQAFTVSQGQTEISFPPGFAMRIANESDMQQDLLVQVLNNNEPQIHRELNFRTTLRYFGEQEARQRKLIPLRLAGGSVTPMIQPAPAAPLLQAQLVRPAFKEEILTAADGSRHTQHWLVPPGRQVLATELGMNLAHDTTVHYMWMHVHPYAESIELRDKTANQSVWKGLVHNDPDPKRAAVVSTDTYSSPTGIALHHDHRYELIATYANPTPNYVDAMASLWMYVRADE